MTETRQTFAGLAHWEIVFWYVLIVVSTAIFFWGVAMLALVVLINGAAPLTSTVTDEADMLSEMSVFVVWPTATVTGVSTVEKPVTFAVTL